jgi:hypothetical protein
MDFNFAGRRVTHSPLTHSPTHCMRVCAPARLLKRNSRSDASVLESKSSSGEGARPPPPPPHHPADGSEAMRTLVERVSDRLTAHEDHVSTVVAERAETMRARLLEAQERNEALADELAACVQRTRDAEAAVETERWDCVPVCLPFTCTHCVPCCDSVARLRLCMSVPAGSVCVSVC